MTKNPLEGKIDSLTDAIKQLIAIPVAPVAPVAPVLPIAPVAPVLPIENTIPNDLIVKFTRLEENVKLNFQQVKDAIKDLSDGTAGKIVDFEGRIRTLEKESEDHLLVKRVVYGACGTMLLAVLSSIVYLVVHK
jgi:hypothetical protein